MSQALNRIQDLLGELFQLDTAGDLDFGIYRIMNHKRDEINGFIENSLPNIVENTLSKGSAARQTELADELREKAEQVKQNFGDDAILGLGLTRPHGPIRVERSGSAKGVEDGQDRQALLA